MLYYNHTIKQLGGTNMRVIFLDINGVLTNRNSNPSNFFYGLDQANVACLAKLVQQTEARLILASTWRTEFDAHMNPCSSITKGFATALQNYGLTLYDQTRHLNGGRSKEVSNWLETHDDIESFVILDDTDFNWGILSPYWIPIHSDTGLIDKNVDDAKNILLFNA